MKATAALGPTSARARGVWVMYSLPVKVQQPSHAAKLLQDAAYTSLVLWAASLRVPARCMTCSKQVLFIGQRSYREGHGLEAQGFVGNRPGFCVWRTRILLNLRHQEARHDCNCSRMLLLFAC